MLVNAGNEGAYRENGGEITIGVFYWLFGFKYIFLVRSYPRPGTNGNQMVQSRKNTVENSQVQLQ